MSAAYERILVLDRGAGGCLSWMNHQKYGNDWSKLLAEGKHVAGDASCTSDPVRKKAIQRAHGGVEVEVLLLARIWKEALKVFQREGTNKTDDLMREVILYANPEWRLQRSVMAQAPGRNNENKNEKAPGSWCISDDEMEWMRKMVWEEQGLAGAFERG